MGQDVQCPTCGSTFLAQPGGAPTPSSAPPPPPSPSPSHDLDRPSRRREFDDEDEYDDRDSRRLRRRRRPDYEPHRGTMIMILGILSLVMMPIVLGPIAWIMGNNDLKLIRAGRMDPEGESSTNTGRICGMIGTILGILGLVIGITLVCLWVIFAAALVSATPRGKY